MIFGYMQLEPGTIGIMKRSGSEHFYHFYVLHNDVVTELPLLPSGTYEVTISPDGSFRCEPAHPGSHLPAAGVFTIKFEVP